MFNPNGNLRNSKVKNWLAIVIIAAAMLPRVLLCWVNNQANDNHIDVLNIIADQNRLPEKSECWSCYQPKLFYVVCAMVVKAFSLQGYDTRIFSMQLLNLIASFFILLLFWRFIDKQELSDLSKFAVFGLFGFNACLTGINIQSTNDTFAILFGVITVYLISVYFNRGTLWIALSIATALIAAALTKASGVILLLCICAILGLQLIALRELKKKLKTLLHLSAIVVAFALIVPGAGGYIHNYKKYGSLSLSTWNKDTVPYFFVKTPIDRPGLRSVFDCFFTFRICDMIITPFVSNDNGKYSEHRTSLWSQLYGRTAFMHYDQWPPGWASQTDLMTTVGRLVLVFGLVPLYIFILGISFNIKRLLGAITQSDRNFFQQPANYAYLVITLAMFASSMYYTYNYRDFSSMKSIYIFPGLIAFIKMFCDGVALIKRPKTLLTVQIAVACVVILNLIDIFNLVVQLAERRA